MLRRVALATIALCPAAWARPPAASHFEAAVERTARHPFVELQLVPADGDALSPVWATWRDGVVGRTNAVHLMLLARRAGRVEVMWSRVWAGGYQPTIQRVGAWQHQGRPAVALVYQMGAIAQVLKIYGVSRRDVPKLLGGEDAALFEFRAVSGEVTVIAHDDPPDPLRCFRFDGTSRLRDVTCPARP